MIDVGLHLLGGDPSGLGRLSRKEQVDVLAYRRVLANEGLLGPLGLFGARSPAPALPAAAQPAPAPARRSGGHVNPRHYEALIKQGWTKDKIRAVFLDG